MDKGAAGRVDGHGLIGGRRGGGVGQGGGQGRRLGGVAESGSNKGCTGSTFLGSLKNLTFGLIWLVTRGGWGGRRGGGGPGRRARGDGGGHQRAVWEQQGVN